MGIQITDRIVLDVTGALPEGWQDYVLSETLAALGTVTEAAATVEMADEGITIRIARQ